MTENEKIMTDMLKMYEEELKHYMSEEEYIDFSEQVAKRCFLKSVKRLPDKMLKKFCMENFDTITASDDEFEKALKELKKRRDGDKNEKDNM